MRQIQLAFALRKPKYEHSEHPIVVWRPDQTSINKTAATEANHMTTTVRAMLHNKPFRRMVRHEHHINRELTGNVYG